MHIMNSTEQNSIGGMCMNEKAYKSMSFAGAAGIAIGIIMIVTGVVTGIIAIVSGARLLKDKKGLTF